jgi:hypothetical protein
MRIRFEFGDFFDSQAVVFGKVHDKVSQPGINNNAFHLCDQG